MIWDMFAEFDVSPLRCPLSLRFPVLPDSPVLTLYLGIGNPLQSSTTNKLPSPKVNRNASTRESNGGKPSSPTQRSPTSIDPLTHVCSPTRMTMQGCSGAMEEQCLSVVYEQSVLTSHIAHPKTNEYLGHDSPETSKLCWSAGYLGDGGGITGSLRSRPFWQTTNARPRP